ncbi:hypothetical protein J7E62_27470 [Variovorax paradoxus]|nr:hypothetical protein [Variovorax paradoxus]
MSIETGYFAPINIDAPRRTRAGHWGDMPIGDQRVSHAEQQDYQADIGATVNKVLAVFFLFLLVGIPASWAAVGYLLQR